YFTRPSRAGKTTLLRLIFGADEASSGQELVRGRNLSRLDHKSLPYLRRNIGVVFQDFKLMPRRGVEENVAIVLHVVGMPARTIRRRTYATLKEVGLTHRISHLPQKLSGGEQQRVAIARALVNDPQILLADEPTGNLDAERADEIMELLIEANARGTTVVVATHDPDLLENSGRRVIALEAGRLVPG